MVPVLREAAAGQDPGGSGQVVGDHRAGQPGGVGVHRGPREWAKALAFKSAMTCSTLAWSRCLASAVSNEALEFVITAW